VQGRREAGDHDCCSASALLVHVPVRAAWRSSSRLSASQEQAVGRRALYPINRNGAGPEEK